MKINDEPESYASIISSATLSYIIVVGEVIVLILAIAGLIAFTVLRGELLSSIIDVLLYVILPLSLIIVLYSYYNSKKAYHKALEFHKLANILAEELEIKNGELIEGPAPPFTVVYRLNRKYLIVRRLDGYATIAVLEPIKGVYRKQYMPILVWREKEMLLKKEIDGLKIRITKIEALLPDPKHNEMFEGELLAFINYTYYNIARVVKNVRRLIEKKGIEYYEETKELIKDTGSS